MKIFLINLDRRPDRLTEMTARLNALGLEFERISAFDGKSRSTRGLVAWGKAFVFNNCRMPSAGVIGCYQSHRMVWQRIVENNISQALVLEDDAELHDWDPKIVGVNIADYGLELLRLEASNSLAKIRLPIGQDLLGRKFYDVQTDSSGAYIITKSGAEKYLSLGKFWIPADVHDVVSRITGLRTAVLLPVMSRQGESVSDLSPPKARAITPTEIALKILTEIWWRLRRPAFRAAKRMLVGLEARKRDKMRGGQ